MWRISILPLSSRTRRTGVYALHELDIQILHVERVVFDEFSTRFHVFAHQRGEDSFALGYVFQSDLQERAALGIHGGFPELLGGHFSQAFVALDGVLLAAFVQDVIEKFAGGVFLDDFGLFRSSFERRKFAGFPLRCLGLGFSGRAQICAIILARFRVFVFLFFRGGAAR